MKKNNIKNSWVKYFIIIAGLAITSNGYAAQEVAIQEANSGKMSPRQAHAHHAQIVREKRHNARQIMLVGLQGGRDRSNLSTQIMDSVHSWSKGSGNPDHVLLPEANFAARKHSMHEELLSQPALRQDHAPQDFADSIKAAEDN